MLELWLTAMIFAVLSAVNIIVCNRLGERVDRLLRSRENGRHGQLQLPVPIANGRLSPLQRPITNGPLGAIAPIQPATERIDYDEGEEQRALIRRQAEEYAERHGFDVDEIL